MNDKKKKQASALIKLNKNTALSPETKEKLKAYYNLLLKWQKRINLISPNTIDTAWDRHFEDSIQLTQLMPQDGTLYDLGSGAGFPGLILAITCPHLDVHLIESDQKKCAFLKTVSRETGAKVTIHNKRIEQCHDLPAPHIITARALSSLNSLFDYTAPWIKENPEITLLFPKGRNAEQEEEELKHTWLYNKQTYTSVTDTEAQILKFNNIRAQ